MSSVLGPSAVLPWSGPCPRYPAIPSVRNCPGASGFMYTPGFPRCLPFRAALGRLSVRFPSVAVGRTEDQRELLFRTATQEGQPQCVAGAVGADPHDELLA